MNNAYTELASTIYYMQFKSEYLKMENVLLVIRFVSLCPNMT